MKIHEFEIYGGQTQDDQGNQVWPDYVRVKVPRAVHVELIQFLVKSLSDPEMETSTINFVGELETTGEKTVEEMFGPTPNSGKPDA